MLQKLEFEEFMSQLGVFLARQELRVVFDNFDQNKDGKLSDSERSSAPAHLRSEDPH